MPSRTDPKMDRSGGRVRLKAHYGGDILITSVDAMTTFKDLCEEVRDMCGLHQQHPLTLKWVDSEGSLGLGMVGLGMVGLSSTGLCTDELVRTNHSSVGTAANGQIGTVQTGQH